MFLTGWRWREPGPWCCGWWCTWCSRPARSHPTHSRGCLSTYYENISKEITYHSYKNIKKISGVYISVQKRYLFPHPSENDIFSPSRDTSFFDSHRGLFSLNSSLFCIYFTLLLPLFSFSFPFLPFSFPFLPFSFTFSPFFSLPFHIFPQMTSADIFPPRGVFSNI